ncbi:MAG: hypothetical protein RSB23_02230 [Alistipes sp.]
MADGILYHTMPMTLFENSTFGALIFDLTYMQNSDVVTMNFSYWTQQPVSADSVKFISSTSVISGAVKKLYIEPDKKRWKHRYTLSETMGKFSSFFSNKVASEAIIYSKGVPYRYQVKKSDWNKYAPIGYKIFEMIQFNETQGR